MLRDFISDLRYRLGVLFGRDAVEQSMDDEMRFHLEQEIARLVREGRSEADARREALLAFGGVEQVKEEARDAWGVRLVDVLFRDMTQAIRLARKQPGFAAVVVLSLALGLGVTLTAFNLTWNVLFARLTLPNPTALVHPVRWNREGRDDAFTWREVTALRAVPGVGEIAGYRTASAVGFSVGDHREFINVHFLAGNYFDVLGATPLYGRLISERDDAEHAPVVVLSLPFARVMFPDDSNPVGKSLMIRGVAFSVIGVTPASYRGIEFPAWFTAAIPMGAVELLGATGAGRDNRGNAYGRGDDRLTDIVAFQMVGRITTTFGSAQSTLAGAFAQCCAQIRGGDREFLALQEISRGIMGGKGDVRGKLQVTLGMLMAGTLLVLVVVCCNIASILLVRATARQREIAVRLSLGASRARLVWQLITESVPMSIFGCLGGLAFAAWSTGAFVRSLPTDWDVLSGIFAFRMSAILIAATAGLGFLCTLGFAVYPAIRATARPVAQALRLDARASRSRRQGTVARSVIVAQVAVTVVLVAAAALLSASLVQLSRVELGIDSDHMLLAGLESRSTTYEQQGMLPVIERIAQAVEAVPGVRSVTAATHVPLYGGANYAADIRVPGYEPPPDREATARLVIVRPGFFSTAGMPIVSGRGFDATEVAQGAPTVVVNEAFLEQYLKGRNAIGAAFDLEINDRRHLTPVQIIGVARNARYESLRESPRPFVFVAVPQAAGGRWSTMQLIIRTEGAPLLAASAVLKAVERGAPGVEVRRVRDMESQVFDATTPERLTTRLAVFVSVMSLILSAIGLYGVVGYGVSRRTSEIGVRLALGARTRSVLWLVSRETIWLVGIGVAIGLGLSYVANGAIQSQIYGVGAHDPLLALGAASVLAAVGLVASIVPARRATRIDPKVALNAD